MAPFCMNITKKNLGGGDPQTPLQAQFFQILYIHINKNKFQNAYERLHIIIYTISCTVSLQK